MVRVRAFASGLKRRTRFATLCRRSRRRGCSESLLQITNGGSGAGQTISEIRASLRGLSALRRRGFRNRLMAALETSSARTALRLTRIVGRGISAVLLGILYLATAGCALLSAGDPNQLSVCEVLAAPGDFDGRLITIRGVLVANPTGGLGLTDARCDQGAISFGAESQARSGRSEVQAALLEARGIPNARVMVAANGLIVWRSGETPPLVMLETQYSRPEVVTSRRSTALGSGGAFSRSLL